MEEFEKRFEWERREGNTRFLMHAVAGSCAGVMEHVAMFPLDSLKTRVQAGGGTAGAVLRAALARKGGARSLFRGAAAISSGCVPAHAALFSVYEFTKARFDTSRPAIGFLCGAAATLAHDVILTPLDVVKQRLQLDGQRRTMDCIRHVVTTEGTAALFRSVPTTLLMNLPYGALMVATNERLKKMVKLEERLQADSDDRTALALYFLCAGVSGGLASALTTPLDVIKTKLQTQAGSVGNAVKYTGFVPSCRVVLAEEGLRGFWRGAAARTCLGAPGAAICWGTYELANLTLQKVSRKTGRSEAP
eukprot:Polyplicarium_translucidae@DN2942_c0_g1_i2.p1